MVGEAAEGLDADDIGHAGIDQLAHLRGEQPALAHLAAHAQHAVQLAAGGLVGGGGIEAGI